jgi:hypothetical protein
MRTHMVVRVGCCFLLLATGWEAGGAYGARKGAKGGGANAAVPATQPALPAPVQKTVTDHFPNGTVVGYERENEDLRNLFFVDIKNDGKTVTLLASGRGQYLGVVSEEPGDDDDNVYLDAANAPPAVQQAIWKYFAPTTKSDKPAEPVTLDCLFMEVEKAQFIFCAEKTTGNITKWISFSLTGELKEEETELPLADLPAPVKEGVMAAHPQATLDSASIVKSEGKTYYTVSIATPTQKLILTVGKDGTVQNTENDDSTATKP